MEDKYINIDDDEELFSILEKHHIIFQTFWSVGNPTFSNEIDTAAVGFDRSGKAAYMIFNPQFWNSLDSYNKAFVIAHECLHIILNHGARAMHMEDKDFNNINIAQDIVINEMLVNGFGFNKYLINNWKQFCFVDTVFNSDLITRYRIKKNESFEYYLGIIEKKGKKKNIKTLDTHQVGVKSEKSEIEKDIDKLQKNSKKAFSKFLDEIDDVMSFDEIEKLDDIFKKEFEKMTEGSYQAGNNSFSKYVKHNISDQKKLKKWESIVINNIKSLKAMDETVVKSWISRDRNSYCLSEELFIQGSWQGKKITKSKYDIVFFLDTSGSCYSYAERFLKLIKTIPKDKFKIKAFTFTTKIYELDLEKCETFSTGGTSFKILTNKVNKITEDNKKHPDLVFVLTDGYGNKCNVVKPEVWHWLLTPVNSDNYIDEKSHKHMLKDFI